MKITRRQLRTIIKEELSRIVEDDDCQPAALDPEPPEGVTPPTFCGKLDGEEHIDSDNAVWVWIDQGAQVDDSQAGWKFSGYEA